MFVQNEKCFKFAARFSMMPHRLIGRTADFGSVSLGSSPSGATYKPEVMRFGFFCALNSRVQPFNPPVEVILFLQKAPFELILLFCQNCWEAPNMDKAA